jgi:hypothetical protein
MVASDFGRCRRIMSAVRPGQVANTPSWTASIQVEGTGLKHAVCRYCTRSLCVLTPTARLHTAHCTMLRRRVLLAIAALHVAVCFVGTVRMLLVVSGSGCAACSFG